PTDQFFAIGGASGASGASVGAYNLGSAGIVLTDATNAVFINDNLPTVLNLSDFTAGQRLIELNFTLEGDARFGAVLEANISDLSIAQTPLPAALPLFAGGLGALGLLGWRRKKKAEALAA